METPSSTRRITRSQTKAASNNNSIPISKKIEESDKGVKSRKGGGKQQERCALVDVTNDSPIVGVAMGSLETPLSSMAKKKSIQCKMTPGSGEALLRGQVKTLLQKVEEEAELSKLSFESSRPFIQQLQGLITSPMLLAPTPTNTPQVLNLSVEQTGAVPSPMGQELMISQEVVSDLFEGMKKESIESDISPISRSLLSDFSEKSEVSELPECKEKASQEDDDASVWSIQVNASIKDEEEDDDDDDDDDYQEENGEYNEEEEEEEEVENGGIVDELCEGMSKIRVNEENTRGKFTGKHTRFVYNSDDELVEEEEEEEGKGGESSPGVLHLKGLPAPKGKHLRFPTED